jgi:cytochrome c oxidase assembly factor CtaG
VPTIAVGVAAVGYVAARQRLIRSPRAAMRAHAGRGRMICFGAGLLAIVVAVDGPPDALAGVSFSAHMVQHLLLQLVAAPLLLLGAPLSLLLRADPPWLRRRALVRLLRSRPVRVLAHPLVAVGLFTVVLVGSHLTPFYNLTLEQEWLHELEHVAFLVTALLFWWPAIGVDPAPHRLGYPARLLYLFLDMPVMAYLGLAIAASSRVLYPYYAAHPPPWGASPLQDQGVAGTIMWVSGTFTMIPAMAVVLLRWLDEDARTQARREARQDHEARQGHEARQDHEARQGHEARQDHEARHGREARQDHEARHGREARQDHEACQDHGPATAPASPFRSAVP